MNFQILTLKDYHLAQVANIEKNCFALPWSHKSLKEELENDNNVFFVAVKVDDENFICGYCGMQIIIDEGYITNIAALPEFRNLGIGKKLLQTLLNVGEGLNLKFISLEVRKTNKIAVKIYEYAGFKQVGVRRNFYTKPDEDALILTYYF